MKKHRLLAVSNALILLVHVFISYSTQFKLINNKDVGEVSKIYSSLFTPAPVTFAIWGVIYLSLLAFCIYHLVHAWRQSVSFEANKDLLKIGGWFIFNNLATISWLIAWTNERLLLSVILIFAQLISLIIINSKLPVYDRGRGATSKIFTQFPLSIYFAWLTIATIANTSSYLAAMNWGGSISAVTWTVIMISVAVAITVLVVLLRKNVFYGIVVIWALYGIILKRQMESGGNDEPIIRAAAVGIGITIAVCILQLIRNTTKRRQVNYFSN